MSNLPARSLLNALQSHALASGRFERVNGHEPKGAPGNGLSAALWVQRIRPIPSSGLDATTVMFTAQLRIYQNMLSEPQDAIDPDVCDAVDDMMTRYSAGFTLSGLVRSIDLLGANGQPLDATAGYVTIDQRIHRCMTITIPMIVNDVYDQGA